MGRRILAVALIWGALVGFANGFAALAGFGGGHCHRHHHGHHHHYAEAPAVDVAPEAR